MPESQQEQQQAPPSPPPQQPQQLQQRNVMLNLIASRRNRPSNNALAHDVFKEAMFEIRNLSTEIVNSSPNGACLFNSISLGMCGNETMHKELRRKAIAYMRQNRDWLIRMGLEQDEFYIQKGFQTIDAYLNYMEIDTSHADQYETMAISRVSEQPIFVHSLRTDGKWQMFCSFSQQCHFKMTFSLHRSNEISAICSNWNSNSMA